jgi:hypothetical protein
MTTSPLGGFLRTERRLIRAATHEALRRLGRTPGRLRARVSMSTASMMQRGMMKPEGGAPMPERRHESGAGRMMQRPSANPAPASH